MSDVSRQRASEASELSGMSRDRERRVAGGHRQDHAEANHNTSERMSHYAAGRRREYRCQQILEEAGYLTIRAASSKGIADVIAFGPSSIRIISVKSGEARITPTEREGLQALAKSLRGKATVEGWHFADRCTKPNVEVFG